MINHPLTDLAFSGLSASTAKTLTFNPEEEEFLFNE